MTLILEVVKPLMDGDQAPKKAIITPQGGSIGRDSDCSLHLPCTEKLVSRLHGTISYEDNHYHLSDASANGIYINKDQQPLGYERRHTLKNGDMLHIGNFTLRVSVADSTESISRSNLSLNMLQDESEHTYPAATADTQFNRTSSDFGDTLDEFSPPSLAIPADWDLDQQMFEHPAKPTTPKAQVLSFSNRNTKLIEALLEGLGVNENISSEQITPATMTKLGASLRLSLEGHFDTRNQIHQTKSKLSFDKISLTRQKEADPLGHILHTDHFLKVLLDSHHPKQASLVKQLRQCLGFCKEDMDEILACNQLIIDRFFSHLSPEAICESLDKAQQQQAKHDLSLQSMNDGFSSGAKKWSFFQKNWQKIFSRVNASIRKDFESTFLLSHVKRMGAKQHEA